jgi:hypothetical protein
MSLFDYSTTNMHEILVWEIDEHGFVHVELIPLNI